MPDTPPNGPVSRREVFRLGLHGVFLLLLSTLGGALGAMKLTRREPKPAANSQRWQLDPDKCIQCGRCATACVLKPSAVKCTHAFPMCGYCELCFGYFKPRAKDLDTAAENQLCPTGALRRRHVDGPYYEYMIDTQLCIGCGLCVKGCTTFGNGSLFLQVHHDRCLNCNECAIAVSCPSQAYVRVSASHPYLIKGQEAKTA